MSCTFKFPGAKSRGAPRYCHDAKSSAQKAGHYIRNMVHLISGKKPKGSILKVKQGLKVHGSLDGILTPEI